MSCAANVRPSRGKTVRSASKAEQLALTNDSNPLNTDNKTIIAATGTATATTLKPEIKWMTDRQADEKK